MSSPSRRGGGGSQHTCQRPAQHNEAERNQEQVADQQIVSFFHASPPRLPVCHEQVYSTGVLFQIFKHLDQRNCRFSAERDLASDSQPDANLLGKFQAAHAVSPLWWGVSRFPIRSRFVSPILSTKSVDSIGVSIRFSTISTAAWTSLS